MATGYTAKIESGITFEAFVMYCARAFGALAELRDDMTAPIPNAFEPSNYHQEALKKSEDALKALKSITPAQAQKEAEKVHRESVKSAQRSIDKADALRAKYEAMLAAVREWKPPTKDHQGLKDFMVEQIAESIKFDCDQKWARDEHAKLVATVPSGERWLLQKREQLTRDIAYHAEHYADDVRRAEERTQWVRDLRDSLRGVAAS